MKNKQKQQGILPCCFYVQFWYFVKLVLCFIIIYFSGQAKYIIKNGVKNPLVEIVHYCVDYVPFVVIKVTFFVYILGIYLLIKQSKKSKIIMDICVKVNK